MRFVGILVMGLTGLLGCGGSGSDPDAKILDLTEDEAVELCERSLKPTLVAIAPVACTQSAVEGSDVAQCQADVATCEQSFAMTDCSVSTFLPEMDDVETPAQLACLESLTVGEVETCMAAVADAYPAAGSGYTCETAINDGREVNLLALISIATPCQAFLECGGGLEGLLNE